MNICPLHNFLKEIVNIKNNILNLDQNENNLTPEELEEILEYICTVHLCEPVLVQTAMK